MFWTLPYPHMFTAEKERIHNERQKAKTLFGSYKKKNGGEFLTDALETPREATKHIGFFIGLAMTNLLSF